MHGPTDLEWAAKLTDDINGGTLKFADAARDNSDNAEAAQGGDIGWIGKGQLTQEKEDAIFAAPIGKVSEPLVVDGEGLYLYLVSDEQTREPDAEQKAALESSAFSIWYSKQKDELRRDPRPGDLRTHARPDARTAGGTMLDALLAEARLRWQLDATAGLGVVVAERLDRDADRAVASRS